MVIAATKIIARNQIVLGDSISYSSVVSFPIILISSSEVTCDEFSSITGHQRWIQTEKGNPFFKYQQLALKSLLFLPS